MASVADMEITRLSEELKKNRADLRLAAEMGNNLLETNTQLANQLEARTQEMTNKIEELEQDRYNLQIKLDQKVLMETHYSEEMDSLKVALQKEKESQQQFLELEYNSKLPQLRSELHTAQQDLDKAQLNVKQDQERCLLLESQLTEVRDQLQERVNLMNETCSEELAQLHTEVNLLQSDRITLRQELSEAHLQEEKLNHAVERAQVQVQAKGQEVEEIQCQATAYYNILEKAREEIQELKTELQLERMDSQSQKSKGNSLFSEVEDRRVTVEKKLIGYKVKLESITKQYEIMKQHQHSLKVQLSMLLVQAGRQADADHMDRLEQQLAIAQKEIATLSNKLQEAEKTPQQQDCTSEVYEAWSQGLSATEKTTVDFFQKLVEKKQSELETSKTELKTKRQQLVAQDQQVIRYEGKVYTLEKEAEKQQSSIMKLQIKMDELRMKYEPEKYGKKPDNTAPKVKIEKIPRSEKQEESKENKPSPPKDVFVNCPRSKQAQNYSQDTKDMTSTNMEDATDDHVFFTLEEKPLTSVANKPALKSLQRKQVRISENVDVIDGERSPTQEELSTSAEAVGGELEPEKTGKGRVRGKHQHHKVNMVKSTDSEQCAQQ